MAYTTIDKPSDYFNTKLYTGNGSTQSITGVGFQPNWVWIKNRTAAENHFIFDSVRGALNVLKSNSNGTAGDTPDSLTAFTSDGFNLGNLEDTNRSGNAVASWNWKETAAAGFDIVSYTGNESAGRTISHSLSAVPKMMIIKCRNVGKEWTIFHASLGNGKFIELDQTTAVQTATNRWNDTSPTSSVFSVGVDSSVNASGQTYIAYLFSEKKGYSKFGSYTGNGNADGTFVYTGFKPAFFIAKKTNATDHWMIKDNKRPDYNPNYALYANLSNAEDTSSNLFGDFVSNGIKLKGTGGSQNQSGASYIYMAFAENPFVTSTGVPATAR